MSHPPLRICFSTLACPDWSWSDILHNGPRFGYQGVEIRLLENEPNLLSRPEFQDDQLARRRAELIAAKFQVAGLGSSVRFDYLDADVRREQLEIGYRYIDLAHRLRAKFVRVFGDVFTAGHEEANRERVIEQIVEGLTKLGHYAQLYDVQIVMETHGDFAASPWMQSVMERVRHPAVGVLWDTHHPWRFYNESLSETFGRLRPWIRHTHWKDSIPVADAASVRENHSTSGSQQNPQSDVAVDSGSSRNEGLADAGSIRHVAAAKAHSLMSGHKPADYVLFGTGEFPAAEAFHLLDSNGYDGWYSLEWEKAWHPDLAGPLVALPDFPIKLVALAQTVRTGHSDR